MSRALAAALRKSLSGSPVYTGRARCPRKSRPPQRRGFSSVSTVRGPGLRLGEWELGGPISIAPPRAIRTLADHRVSAGWTRCGLRRAEDGHRLELIVNDEATELLAYQWFLIDLAGASAPYSRRWSAGSANPCEQSITCLAQHRRQRWPR